ALQLVLEFPKNGEMFNNILMLLRSKYSASITFYSGSKLKAEIASYYNIPLSRTIAFGNDVNDIELMHTVGKGIATSDSDNHLKSYAYGITDFGVLN
ncbi:21282_t:CDS:2, partial [Entrophospora sp. SA101]